VSPERDDPAEEHEHEQELYEDVPPRSIFAATWFRVVLVVIVLGVIGAVAVPYVLDWMNPPPPPRSAATTKSPMVPAPAPATSAMPTTSERSATDQSPSDKPSLDKPAGDKLAGEKADKKDSTTTIPAPTAPSSSTPAPARTEAKPSAKSEPKMAAKAADKPAPTPAPAESKPQSAMAATDTPSKTPSTSPKSEPAAKSEPSRGAAAKPSAPKQAVARATPTPGSGSGPYWVQVGAFKDPETAKRVAAKLRDENFKVEESLKRVGGGAAPAPTPAAKAPAGASGSSSDQYDVFVTGMSVEDLNRRLAGKGLAAEAASGGVVVKPSLPLRDAVALSKDLAVEGFKVQVRRAAGSGPATVTAPTAPAPSSEGGQELHRVRVGSFSDKAAAVAAARELEAKGYKPYIARGDQ